MTFRSTAPSLAFLGSITLVSAISASAQAAELRVDASAPGGGDGSPASPFDDIQAAIDAAADGDDILVAEGTYSAFEVVAKELQLVGSYDAGFTATSPDTPSIVEGTAAGPVVSLFETGATVLDGFVIRGGERGLLIDADYLSTTNKPIIRNNTIEDNGTPATIGGGVSADHCEASFIGNTVRNNIGDRGAGLATACQTLLVEDNVIEGNVAHGDHGAGLYMTGGSLTVRGNLFRGNEVGVVAGYGWGAGALAYGTGVTATFERNVYTENHAESLGSGAFIDDGAVATFTGDLFHANDCGVDGGAGLFVDGYDTTPSVATLRNVTIASHDCPDTLNNAVALQTYSRVEIIDSIIWGNGGDDFGADDTSMITATYTLSEEPIEGEGNFSADPLFADPAAGDFHVRSTKGRFDPATGDFVMDDVDSPSIDVGDPATGFALEPGPNGLRVNLGHTGNTAEASMGGPGGDPPTGDDSGGDSEGDDSEGGGPEGGASEGGPGGNADDTGSDGGGSDDTAAQDEMTVACACTQTGTTPPWLAVLAIASGAALVRRRRNARV